MLVFSSSITFYFFSVSNFLIEYIFKLNFSETVQGQAKEEQIIEKNQKTDGSKNTSIEGNSS